MEDNKENGLIMKSELTVSNLDDGEIYLINVGGSIFKSHKNTFCKSKYLDDMFNLQKETIDFSNRLIDRDPLIFAVLLNCLRDRNYVSNDICKYKPDILFFQIKFLIEYLNKVEHSWEDKILITKIKNDKVKNCYKYHSEFVRIYIPPTTVGSAGLTSNNYYGFGTTHPTNLNIKILSGWLGIVRPSQELAKRIHKSHNLMIYPDSVYENYTFQRDINTLFYANEGDMYFDLFLLKCFSN